MDKQEYIDEEVEKIKKVKPFLKYAKRAELEIIILKLWALTPSSLDEYIQMFSDRKSEATNLLLECVNRAK